MLQTANITCAHIVDDAFDSLPMEGFEADRAQTLVDNLEPDHFTEITTFLGCETEAELIKALGDLENVHRLFKNRRKLSPYCNGWFNDFLRDRKDKKSVIQPLLSLLRKNGVKCVKCGADYRVSNRSPEPQLVFIDLRLIDVHQTTSTEAAVKVYKKIKNRYQGCVPFVFLMSSLTTLADHRDQFWKDAGVFLTQFDSISKDLFKDRAELTSILCSYSQILPRIRSLYEHTSQLNKAISAAGERVRDKVRSLDIADYFVLHRNTVTAEKTDLGTYLSELLLEYVLFEIEGSTEIWEFAKYLQEWDLKDLPRARFSLKRAALDIYRGNIVHADGLLAWEIERAKGPKQGYFHLGDIFFESAKLESTGFMPKEALVLLTPMCDLARPDGLRSRTMFLCEGKVEPVKLTHGLIAENGIPDAILVNPKKKEELLKIRWNKKKFQVWGTNEIDSFRDGGSRWEPVGRLRPIYALQLQNALMTDMSRIGIQRAPDLLVPHGIDVMIAKGNKWQALDNESLQNVTAAGTSSSGDGSHILYMVDDAVISRVRRALQEWIKGSNADEEAVVALKDIFKQPAWSQMLRYCDHQIQQNNKKEPTDKDAFPIAGLDGILEKNKGAIVFTTSSSQSPYCSASGGTPRDPTIQPAILIFKFVRPS